jgi:hypothetical protein
LLTAGAVGNTLVTIAVSIVAVSNAEDHAKTALVVKGATNTMTSVVVALGWIWIITLKMGSALTSHAVQLVHQAILNCHTSSTKWNAEVIPSLVQLIDHVIPTLSDGWGSGAAGVCITCWLASVSYAAYVLHTKAYMDVALAFLYAVFPMIVIYDLAAISTECGQLLQIVRNKRICDTSDSNHLAISKIESIIVNLNRVRTTTAMILQQRSVLSNNAM